MKPWDQFLNYCDRFANTEGSWLQAAQAEDERHLAQWELLYENASRRKTPPRPSLAGYDGLRSELRGFRNDIRALLGRGQLPELLGPPTPMDEIKARKKSIGDRRLDAALGYDEEVS